MTKAIPDGYHTLTPYLIVTGGAKALEFYGRAFGAVERDRMQDPNGKVRHAEITIGDSRIMLADEHPEIGALSPQTIGGSPISLSMSRMSMPWWPRRSPRAPSSRVRSPINSMAIASAASPIRSAIAGSSPRTRRI